DCFADYPFERFRQLRRAHAFVAPGPHLLADRLDPRDIILLPHLEGAALDDFRRRRGRRGVERVGVAIDEYRARPVETSRCTVERMRAVSGGAGRWKCMGSKDQFFSASAGSSQVTAKSSVALCT